MTHYWLGFLTGAGSLACLVILTLVAIRGAEHNTPIAGGRWPMDDTEDDLEAAHRRLLEQDTA